MKEEEYINIQNQILAIRRIIKDLPLTEFITAIDRADTLGPIIDPTLWIKGNEQMKEIRELATCLLLLQKIK